MTFCDSFPGIDLDKPVQVYRNLHKPGYQYSIRQDGKVRLYLEFVVLRCARFKHATPKQLAEVRSGARQVCQWVSGYLSAVTIDGNYRRVESDPKKSDGVTIDGEKIYSCAVVQISEKGCFAA